MAVPARLWLVALADAWMSGADGVGRYARLSTSGWRTPDEIITITPGIQHSVRLGLETAGTVSGDADRPDGVTIVSGDWSTVTRFTMLRRSANEPPPQIRSSRHSGGAVVGRPVRIAFMWRTDCHALVRCPPSPARSRVRLLRHHLGVVADPGGCRAGRGPPRAVGQPGFQASLRLQVGRVRRPRPEHRLPCVPSDLVAGTPAIVSLPCADGCRFCCRISGSPTTYRSSGSRLHFGTFAGPVPGPTFIAVAEDRTTTFSQWEVPTSHRPGRPPVVHLVCPLPAVALPAGLSLAPRGHLHLSILFGPADMRLTWSTGSLGCTARCLSGRCPVGVVAMLGVLLLAGFRRSAPAWVLEGCSWLWPRTGRRCSPGGRCRRRSLSSAWRWSRTIEVHFAHPAGGARPPTSPAPPSLLTRAVARPQLVPSDAPGASSAAADSIWLLDPAP
jgi:hypothetical protein